MNISFGFTRFALVATALGVMTACTTDPNDPGVTAGTGGANTGTGSTLGGTAGAGGMGGGAPAGSVCASPIPIAAATPGIADFDAYDGVSDIGTWFTSLGGNSTTGVLDGPFGYGDRPNGLPETFEMTAGQSSMYALRIADTLAQNYGGGLGTWLSACLNATNFAGISFWIRGNLPMGQSTLTLSMGDTTPSTPAKAGDKPGTCAVVDSTTCVHPTFLVDVTSTWTKVQVPWSAFTPGKAGETSVTPDGRNITQIQFGVGLIWGPNTAGVYAPTPAPYELVVDTLSFY